MVARGRGDPSEECLRVGCLCARAPRPAGSGQSGAGRVMPLGVLVSAPPGPVLQRCHTAQGAPPFPPTVPASLLSRSPGWANRRCSQARASSTDRRRPAPPPPPRPRPSPRPRPAGPPPRPGCGGLRGGGPVSCARGWGAPRRGDALAGGERTCVMACIVLCGRYNVNCSPFAWLRSISSGFQTSLPVTARACRSFQSVCGRTHIIAMTHCCWAVLLLARTAAGSRRFRGGCAALPTAVCPQGPVALSGLAAAACQWSCAARACGLLARGALREGRPPTSQAGTYPYRVDRRTSNQCRSITATHRPLTGPTPGVREGHRLRA